MKKLNIEIETHGCKLNFADSQSIAKKFYSAGHNVFGDNEIGHRDIYILNSCTVTHVADSKARQSIRKVKRSNPEAVTIMTGCYAERDKDKIKEINEVDLVITNQEKKDILKKVYDYFNEELVEIPALDTYPLIGRSRASIKIQEGCNQICSYCIIPYVRGREKSVEPNEIISKINNASRNNIKEVVLTGTQLGNYGFDLKNTDLKELIKQVLIKTSIERIRVSSLQPKEIDNELLDIWKSNDRLCPHFHLPLQSGSDQILKKMRRRYSSEEFIQITSLIKKYLPQASITTDVIVGFPSEKEEDFENTLYTINKSYLNNLHVFPYSVRPKTTAFYLKDHNSPEVIKSRSRELNRISKSITTKSMRNIIGKKRSILWEGKNMNSGLTEDYYRVIRKSVKLPNEYISKQKIKGLEKDKLYI
ncbi:MAG: tRNA (N(6)-L-threonylcarbamoyladenosine(37)-C(2))-methylthiotransferase MtaB [Chloroflexota bacterium]|nr:MAG: tRNA (N(6)-L-threonylcarbamoyladenosine(37)-C(2))-methylthiotransferase MtaB [Chloroflexota bacterium]